MGAFEDAANELFVLVGKTSQAELEARLAQRTMGEWAVKSNGIDSTDYSNSRADFKAKWNRWEQLDFEREQAYKKALKLQP